MTVIDIRLEGDRAFPELASGVNDGSVALAELTGLALLPDGEVRKPSGEIALVPLVILRFEFELEGRMRTGLVQLKVEVLETLLGAIRGRLAYLKELEAAGGAPS